MVSLVDRTSPVFWEREVNMVTAASMASLRRWMGTESWCLAAVRPCRPLFRSTRLLRAAFSMEATVEAAVQEEEKEEASREAGEECMRIFDRSWTIKPG